MKEQLSLRQITKSGESSGWLSVGQMADISRDGWSVSDEASWNSSMAMWYERRYTANMKGVMPNKFLLEKKGRDRGEEERGVWRRDKGREEKER